MTPLPKRTLKMDVKGEVFLLFFVAAMLQQRKILTTIWIFCKNISSTFRRAYTHAVFSSFLHKNLAEVFAQNLASSITRTTGIS